MYKFRPITICRYAQKTSWIRKDYVETQILIWKKEKKKKSGKNSLIWWNRKKYHDNLHKRKYNNNTAKAFRELFSSLYYWVPKISEGFRTFQLGRQKTKLYLVKANTTKDQIKSHRFNFSLPAHCIGTIQVLRHQRGGWVGSENGNFWWLTVL